MEAECNFEKRIEIQSIRDHTCWIQKENKMNVENLAMVMGPTILGNSSNEPMAVMSEVTRVSVHFADTTSNPWFAPNQSPDWYPKRLQL